MIAFFRKIRQRLLTENRISKYLIYAVGEILLVVIGILIAVQINTWVNKTKLTTDNKVLLEKMITELEHNKARMHSLAFGTPNIRNISLEHAVNNSDSLLKMTYRGLNQSDLNFILNENISSGGSNLNLQNSIYQELLSTGKLYTLGSDTLIIAIKNYFKRCEREEYYNKTNNEFMYDGFDLIDNSYNKLKLDYSLDSSNFSLAGYPWFFDKTSDHYQNLQIALDKINSGQSNNLYKMKLIIIQTDKLISVIQAELTNKYD